MQIRNALHFLDIAKILTKLTQLFLRVQTVSATFIPFNDVNDVPGTQGIPLPVCGEPVQLQLLVDVIVEIVGSVTHTHTMDPEGDTVEPLNKDTFGTSRFVFCSIERLSSFRGDFL